MASIIIPAHNEEATIGNLLALLAPEHRRGYQATHGTSAIEIIVACNGCTDNTFERASEHEPWVTVLDIPTASKVHALNAADRIASYYPRVYLDADVHLDWPGLSSMLRALEKGPYSAISAAAHFDSDEACWAVRQYYKAWITLPFQTSQTSVSGNGVYILSESGRLRFKEFPNVINDDGFIDRLFPEEEKKKVTGVDLRIRTPKTWSSLINVKSRTLRGNRQLGGLNLKRGQPNSSKFVLRSLFSARALPSAIYLITQVAARLRAWGDRGEPITWHRDHTSRE